MHIRLIDICHAQFRFLGLVILLSVQNAFSATNTLEINVTDIQSEVERGVLGNNIKAYLPKDKRGIFTNKGGGIWNDKTHKPQPQFISAAKDAGISALRWPGGNQARVFEWESSIGPLSKRKNQIFGLPEFLIFSEAVDAEPIITLKVDTKTPVSAANLIEYLNAPADGSNPNGGVDYAAIRKQDGRERPWNVTWFEFGNEMYTTNYSSKDYIDNYLATYSAIKKVDSTVKLGAELDKDMGSWAVDIVSTLGEKLDFVAIHPYTPVLPVSGIKSVPKLTVAKAALASGEDFSYLLDRFGRMLELHTDRDSTPLFLTEYNGNYNRDEPIPYRYTLFNAIHNAELLSVMLRQEHNVKMANYWLFANEHWGMVRGGLGKNPLIRKQADQLMFEIFSNHLGHKFLGNKLVSSTFPFSGALGVAPQLGSISTVSDTDSLVIKDGVSDEWSLKFGFSGNHDNKGSSVIVNFDGEEDIAYYHARRKIEVEPNTRYRITTMVKTTGLENGKVGVVVEDTRGWSKMFYQSKNVGLTGTNKDWVPLVNEFHTLPDAKKIRVVGLRKRGKGKVKGVVEFGDVTVEKLNIKFSEVKALSSVVTLSEDKKSLYILLINKDLENNHDIKVTLAAGGEWDFQSAQLLSGQSPFDTNYILGGGVQLTKLPSIPLIDNQFSLSLPAVSVTGITLSLVE